MLNPAKGMRLKLLLFLLAAHVNLQALIFPLQPGSAGEYDAEFNTLHSFSALWSSNHHAIYNIAALNAVAVAPRWLLTAWHVAKQLDERWYVNDDYDRYYLVDKVDLDNDLALIKVDHPMPFYSQLQKFPVGNGDMLTMYGQSAAPTEPIYDSRNRVVGWDFPNLTNHPALRWGRGRQRAGVSDQIEWDFTDSDQGLGAAGLNCAGVYTNDSGGGIFLRDQLVGITIGLLTQGFRRSTSEPIVPECELSRSGLLFDTSTLYRCTSDFRPVTSALGTPVYPALSNIFAHVSPPLRVNAGGPALTEAGQDWQAGIDCAGCASYVDAGAALIDLSSATNPAPAAIYRSCTYVSGKAGAKLTFAAEELIKYEKYQVRLHFSSIFPADAPGSSTESIIVNGAITKIDPYAGPRKTLILSLQDISPDNDGRIVVEVRPENPAGNACISGIEIAMKPIVAYFQTGPTWDVVSTYPSFSSRQGSPPCFIAFGNDAFVAATFGHTQGLLLTSNDEAKTWQPSAWISRYAGVSYLRDRFFALATGSTTTPPMATSKDGRNWTPIFPGLSGGFVDAAFGNGVYVATGVLVDSSGTAQPLMGFSEDGSSWQIRTNLSFFPRWVAFGNGRFLAVDTSAGAGPQFSVSANGVDWTRVESDFPPPDPSCQANCPGWSGFGRPCVQDNLFVFSANPPSGEGQIFTSADGISWRRREITLPKPFFPLKSAHGRVVDLAGRISSTDLTQWQQFQVPLFPHEATNDSSITSKILSDVTYGTSNYVLFGIASFQISGYPGPFPPTSLAFAKGPDLNSLERIDRSGASLGKPNVAEKDGTVVIVNPYPDVPIPFLISTNSGAAFSPVDLPPDSSGLLTVAYAQQQFVAVGRNGKILHSRDGAVWLRSSTDATNDLFAVTFGNGHWIAAGTNGTALVSTNGESFQAHPSGTASTIYSVAFGAAGFIAVGQDGTVLKSADGEQWDTQQLETGDLYGIAYGDGNYVTVGTNGYAHISTDGIHWNVSRPTSVNLRDIAYTDGFFVTLDPSNPPILYKSTDGISWSRSSPPTGSISMNQSGDSLWIASSGLTNAVSRLRLKNPEVTLKQAPTPNEPFRLEFNAPIAGAYAVLSTPNLAESWSTNATLIRQDSDRLFWTSTNTTDRTRYYRVRLP